MSIVFMNQERGLQQKLAAPVANEDSGTQVVKKVANRQLIGVSTSCRNHKM